MFIYNLQIPDKVLERRPPSRETVRDSESSSVQSHSSDESKNYIVHDDNHRGQNGRPAPRPRRLSTYEDGDAMMDPESGEIRRSARCAR